MEVKCPEERNPFPNWHKSSVWTGYAPDPAHGLGWSDRREPMHAAVHLASTSPSAQLKQPPFQQVWKTREEVTERGGQPLPPAARCHRLRSICIPPTVVPPRKPAPGLGVGVEREGERSPGPVGVGSELPPPFLPPTALPPSPSPKSASFSL